MKTGKEVIIPPGMIPPPEQHEIEAAWILTQHYNCTVQFLKPSIGYKVKTADFVMLGVLWELKSPTSDSYRRCVSKRLDRAGTQSRSIVFDGRRTSLTDEFLHKELIKELAKRSSIERLIFITKNSEVIALK